ncbi:MAG TPA: TIGR03435 family protein [Verrucomicrobiae bacterium]|jgi:uncharacterized protein (TIGR03435 family)
MTQKTTIAIVAVAGALAICALVTVVKHNATPVAKDSWFTVSSDGLAQLPAGLAVLRPTRRLHSSPKIRHTHDGDSLTRIMGRNTSFRDLMAEAYDCDPGNIVLPPGAPQGEFDFLVTKSPEPRQHLRDIIQRQLGYVAHHETRDTAVFKLQVADTRLSSFAISPKSEDDDITYTNGRLYFIHKPISLVVLGLEDGLGMPVLDETGMSNNYDFSMPWNSSSIHALQSGLFSEDRVKNVLATLGLGLASGTESMDMVIVEKKP